MMKLSEIPADSGVGRLLRLPLRLIPKGTKVPILQGTLKGHKWIVGSSVHGCWAGIYEPSIRGVFERLVKPHSVVFDIGAHVGFYTLLASVLVGSEGKVVAFEPLPQNLSYLKEHITINGINNVTVIDAAVANYCGETFFQIAPDSSMGRINTSEGDIKITVCTLDHMISSHQITTPDLIKMDIEGAEMLALEGANALLSEARPTILLSTHGDDIRERCCDYLVSLGYQLRPIGAESLHETRDIIAFNDDGK